MQISSSFVAEVPNLHPQCFQGQPTPRQLLPEPPSFMLNDSISSLLLSLSLTSSLLSDISTLALLLVSFKESQYIAHTTLRISLSSFLSPGDVSHTPRCSTHAFFQLCFLCTDLIHFIEVSSSLQCVSIPYLQAKRAGPSASLTLSSLSPLPG